MKAKLTDAQADLLMHRLEGPDDLIYGGFGFACLAALPHYTHTMRGDSLTEDDFKVIRANAPQLKNWEMRTPWAEADGDEARDILSKQVHNRVLDTSGWNEACPELLAELMEGSTYVCAVSDHPLEYSRAARTMRALVKKLEPLVGREIDGVDV